ncbi:MAG: hypothetical protein NUV69_00625 [Candidatus Curtissbacteria bacterium]|nr:hypothetical protein [Candidatus Curtissbacteria bacterium]
MAEELDNLTLMMLLNNKETGFNYRERREEDWRENYELYRDKVTINRLTQRQSVNLPLMKTTLRTLLKDVDDMPVIEFENLDNDKQAEVFQNEYWKWTLEQNNATIQDIVDKKQDFFFGRSFDSWQVEDGRIVFDIEDPEDILVDRFMNPYDIDSSRFLIHTHIFRPLSSLKNNHDYDQEEVKKLEQFFESQLGIIKAKDNENSLQQKNKKLADMGVTDTEDPVLGETYVELTMHFVFREGEKIDKKTVPDQIFVFVEAEEQTILMKKPQEEIIGTTQDHYWRNHFRYNTWGDDIDKQDFWTDGIADIVRVPNKVLNSWFSQLVENRTLRNFGMHYYDSSLKADGFIPSTFNPVPWGWYPVPGKPSDVLQKVDIPDLSESIDEMDYVVGMTEKATGATTTQQGIETKGQTTLGEVQLAQGEAKARTQGMSKFYTRAWEQRATKFLKLIEAAKDKLDAVKIYKEGKNTSDVFEREISPKDWMTKAGYRVKVWSQDEKKANDTDSLNKMVSALNLMPGNPKLLEVMQRKALELADLKPDEIAEIIQFEEQKAQMIAQGLMAPPMPPGAPGQPQQQPPIQFQA